MNNKDISQELKDKVCACHTPEELFELAKEEGFVIPDNHLDGIAGGGWCDTHEWSCPADKCGVYGIGR